MALAAILNGTLVGLFKCFYGRYAGSEGTLKTEVVDTVLLEIPDPRGISRELAEHLTKALDKMTQREVTHLVEDALLECHSEEAMRDVLDRPPQFPQELRQADRRELDECVLELIGITEKRQRQQMLDELYRETTKYYRYQRTQDIQAMEDRSGKKSRRLGPQDLAESIWSSLAETEKGPPILDWIASSCRDTVAVEIPEGKPEALGPSDMFNPNAVIFRGDKKPNQMNYASPEQAALVVELAGLGLNGLVEIPKSASSSKHYLEQLRARLSDAEERFTQLVGSRTGSQSLQEKTIDLLLRWYIHGKGH